MNKLNKLDGLLELAKTVKPDPSQLEIGFETRLMARLSEYRANEFAWPRFIWKLAPIFMFLSLMVGMISLGPEFDQPINIGQAIMAAEEDYGFIHWVNGE